MNEVQVVTFCSGNALYGVIIGQIASLRSDSGGSGSGGQGSGGSGSGGQDSGVPGSGSAVDLVRSLEGSAFSRTQADQSFVITTPEGSEFRIPGPMELLMLHPDDFQLTPLLVSRLREDSAIRAAFAVGDSIGLLVDLDRVIVSA